MQTLARTSVVLSVVLSACGSTVEVAEPLPVANYRPATFPSDIRRERINEVLSNVNRIFADNAEEHHHVGQIWGIVVDDELIFRGRYGVANIETQRPVDIHSKFHIASLTKSFTSMAILKLRDAGRLSLQDPVALHVPELAAVPPLTSDAPAVTVENLMTMTSGFPEDNPWADRRLEDSTAELLALVDRGLSYSNIPGVAYEYSNLGYALLGTIITRVSGRPYEQYITEEILEPLGMFETYWDYANVPPNELAIGYRFEDEQWKREPMLRGGAFGAIGGLITSMHDMSRYISFHLSAWPPRSAPDDGPVRRSTVREMHVPSMPRLYADATDSKGRPCPLLVGYGYGLGIRKDCRGLTRISHTGGLPGFGTNIQFFPEIGVGMISFANLTYARSSEQHDAVNALLFEDGRLGPRTLPVADILEQRASEVAELIRGWDPSLGDRILAANFYLDRSRDRRKALADRAFERAGRIVSVDPVRPQNQLRGTFLMRGENADVQVYFTLSPESPARVQRLDVSSIEHRNDG